jgi:glycosyltransferase involved in cell wall biosynthesis
MLEAGFISETFTTHFYSVHQRSDWDRVLSEEYKWAHPRIKPFIAFLHALFRYDIFFISFNGFFVGNTSMRYWQAQLLKLANKKIVVIPYGSDAYVYRRLRSTGTIHGLLMSYPAEAKRQTEISRDVDYWCRHADVVIPGIMGLDGLGRWDALMLSALSIDLRLWNASKKWSPADGRGQTVIVVHAPNHRGIKGTEFVIDAVQKLQAEGLRIELRLLENLQNHEVRRILGEEADILVEQLIGTGHGLNAIEGMASGLPTISNLEDDAYMTPLRRWSYFSECPLVSATPENLVEVLRKLVTRPELRHELGRAGRAYVEKYHGLDSSQYLFTNVIDYLYGRKDSLINLYHPLLGEYPNRSPKIQHPLFNNRIIN